MLKNLFRISEIDFYWTWCKRHSITFESWEKTYGIKSFCFLLMRIVTNLAKYPESTGFNGVSWVLMNLKSLSSNKYLPPFSSSSSSLVYSSGSGSEIGTYFYTSTYSCSLSSSVTSFSSSCLSYLVSSSYFYSSVSSTTSFLTSSSSLFYSPSLSFSSSGGIT